MTIRTCAFAGSRRLAPAALVLAAALMVAALSGGPRPAAANWDSETAAFLTLINEHRQQGGRAPLAVDAALQRAAEWHSNDQLNTRDCPGQPDPGPNACDHTDTQGRDAGTRIRQGFGYTGNRTGENIFWALPQPDARQAFDAWRESPGHNENMLRAEFGAIGISRLCRADGWCFWTTTFGDRVIEPFTPPGGAPAPTPATATPAAAPTQPPAAPGTTPLAANTGWDQETQSALDAINAHRAAQATPLPPLAVDATLQRIAAWMVNDQFTNRDCLGRAGEGIVTCRTLDSLVRTKDERLTAFAYLGTAEELFGYAGLDGLADITSGAGLFTAWRDSTTRLTPDRLMLDGNVSAIGLARQCRSLASGPACMWVAYFGSTLTQPFTPPAP